jgi:uncharacterized protein (TIGR00730 family)
MGFGAHYVAIARELGRTLAQHNHSLIYGGGNVGLMGILADTMLELNREVIGVIPDFLLQREVGHLGLTRLEVVNTMHERKKRMADLSDAFMAIPGGWGTLDELAEILTWKQLGLIHQPIGILNTNNFFEPLIKQMQIMVTEGFLKKENFDSLIIETTPSSLIEQFSL